MKQEKRMVYEEKRVKNKKSFSLHKEIHSKIFLGLEKRKCIPKNYQL